MTQPGLEPGEPRRTCRAPLAGRVAIVTGGSTGVGRGIAIALAESGAAVVVGYHRDADGAADTCATITAGGGRAVACGRISRHRTAPRTWCGTAVRARGGSSM